jgi:hypothetical protein
MAVSLASDRVAGIYYRFGQMPKKTSPMLSETRPVVNKYSWLFGIGRQVPGIGYKLLGK